MSEAHETAGPDDHAAHLAGGPVPTRKKRAVRWRLAYVGSMLGLAASLFLFVPDGGSLALLVLFAGLMVLHHLPGGHGHNHQGTGTFGPQSDATQTRAATGREEAEK